MIETEILSQTAKTTNYQHQVALLNEGSKVFILTIYVDDVHHMVSLRNMKDL